MTWQIMGVGHLIGGDNWWAYGGRNPTPRQDRRCARSPRWEIKHDGKPYRGRHRKPYCLQCGNNQPWLSFSVRYCSNPCKRNAERGIVSRGWDGLPSAIITSRAAP